MGWTTVFNSRVGQKYCIRHGVQNDLPNFLPNAYQLLQAEGEGITSGISTETVSYSFPQHLGPQS